MAGISKAEREARAAAAEQAQADKPSDQPAEQAAAQPLDDGLVAMSKGGETLRIHPSCVGAHKSAGWTAE